MTPFADSADTIMKSIEMTCTMKTSKKPIILIRLKVNLILHLSKSHPNILASLATHVHLPTYKIKALKLMMIIDALNFSIIT